jgi:predicted ABC-type ATPase
VIECALDDRPVIVAIAGPNGAGKTTFFHSHLREAGLRFINADDIARELTITSYEAAELANALRLELVRQRESFVFETVFSDPIGDKLTFLKDASVTGYNVVLCFIGISGPATSEERVGMRVSQGGHDVPSEKLVSRFPRTLANLDAAIQTLPTVLVFDNQDLAAPFRKVAEFQNGKSVFLAALVPQWLHTLR